MINDLIYARQYVERTRAWLVVIVPPEQFQEAQKLFAGAVVGNAVFGGRTASLPNGGKLSLVSALDSSFVPLGEPYDAMFIGWGGKASAATEMTRWRKSARRTVTRSA